MSDNAKKEPSVPGCDSDLKLRLLGNLTPHCGNFLPTHVCRREESLLVEKRFRVVNRQINRLRILFWEFDYDRKWSDNN